MGRVDDAVHAVLAVLPVVLRAVEDDGVGIVYSDAEDLRLSFRFISSRIILRRHKKLFKDDKTHIDCISWGWEETRVKTTGLSRNAWFIESAGDHAVILRPESKLDNVVLCRPYLVGFEAEPIPADRNIKDDGLGL